MTREQLSKIIAVVTKECTKNFDKHKSTDYTIANKTLIPFTSKTISSRKVSDWGTDEDRDIYVCYTENGWAILDMIVQTGAGVQKVIQDVSTDASIEVIADKVLEMGLWNQIEFINKAYDVLFLSEYKSELY